mgnify:CR=1 FL=1
MARGSRGCYRRDGAMAAAAASQLLTGMHSWGTGGWCRHREGVLSHSDGRGRLWGCRAAATETVKSDRRAAVLT